MNTTTLPRSIRKALALAVIGLGTIAPVACSTGGDDAAGGTGRVAAASAERGGSTDADDPSPRSNAPEAPAADTAEDTAPTGRGIEGEAPQAPASGGGSGGGTGSGGTSGAQPGGGSSGSGGGGEPASPSVPTTPAPAITSFVTPESIDCHNGDFQQFTASFTTTGAVRTTISIDGPGVYAEYGPSAEVDLPFNCSSSHSFMLTAYGSDGRSTSKSVTLHPRNVQTQGSEAEADPATQP